MAIDELLAIPGGLLWVACYGLILRRAWLDKSPGMPLVALAANLSWELIYGFVLPDQPPMDSINQIWFLVDLALLGQTLRYGRADLSRRWPPAVFLPLVLLAVAMASGVILGVRLEFADVDGRYTGWAGNLLMSALFITMLVRRGSSAGQSLYIGLARMLGTLFFDGAQLIKTPSWPLSSDLGPLMTVLYLSCLALDLLYLWLLARQLRAEGKRPWHRL